jgi:TRAP-type uncharacterized transport system substrate-binding protein
MSKHVGRKFWISMGAAFVLVTAGFFLTLQFVDPAPPKKVVIAAAGKDTPYYRLAAQYQRYFAENGVNLEIKETTASFENLKLLTDAKSGVDIGILQGGIASNKDAPDLRSMGRVSYEPLWVFYRGSEPITRLSELKGKRILVGPTGGGTHHLAMRLLAASGITNENATLVPMHLPNYVEAFETAKADAGFLVLGADANTVQRLFQMPGVQLMSFAQADGYSQRFPFLSRLDLKQGVVDFGRNIPAEDTALVATKTALVVRDSLHPAITSLLAEAVLVVHGAPEFDPAGEAKLFQRVGDFPIIADPEFVLADDARRVYKSGPRFLQRYLPFWLATLLERMTIMLVPLVGLLIPAMRITPSIYPWLVRRRIMHWYRELRSVEASLTEAATPEQLSQKLSDLDRIDEGVRTTQIPQNFADQFYQLRAHIDVVRRRVAVIKPTVG